jgi:hypothetical protein
MDLTKHILQLQQYISRMRGREYKADERAEEAVNALEGANVNEVLSVYYSIVRNIIDEDERMHNNISELTSEATLRRRFRK